ncbi:hypothetical protein CENA302_05945 [Cylindrospermopsis raciborskii CENA302]|uniref:Uncharacterized protein n=1 Tax=Cylindrospermopsis raciborskii CENA302 TaxID=1170768 RepID=A0A9Q5QYA4_9CYAN|nr:hypothetical protein CENA302_05945 [Cylindrospermopsis raciborskii CENA302]
MPVCKDTTVDTPCAKATTSRYVLNTYKRLEWDFFSDLRKVGLDSRQGKGLKWRESPLSSRKWN